MPTDTTIANIIELLKLAGPVLSAVLLFLYRRQRLQANANQAAINSVIQVNDELRKELDRKATQLRDMEVAQARLEAALDEQRANHTLEMDRLTRLWAERNRELEAELQQARETVAQLRIEVAQLEAQVRLLQGGNSQPKTPTASY